MAIFDKIKSKKQEVQEKIESSKSQLSTNDLLKTEHDLNMDVEGHIYTTLSLSKSIEKYFKPINMNSIEAYEPADTYEDTHPIEAKRGFAILTNHMQVISYLYQYYKLDRAFTLEQACALAAIAECESKCNPTFPKADYIDLNNNIIDTSYNKGFKEFRSGEYDYAAGLLGFKTYERKKKLIEYIEGIVDNDHPPLIENYSLYDQLEMIIRELYDDEDYQYIVNLMNNNEHDIEEVTTILYDNYSNQSESLEYAISASKELRDKYSINH